MALAAGVHELAIFAGSIIIRKETSGKHSSSVMVNNRRYDKDMGYISHSLKQGGGE